MDEPGPDSGCLWVGFRCGSMLLSAMVVITFLAVAAHYLVELWDWIN